MNKKLILTRLKKKDISRVLKEVNIDRQDRIESKKHVKVIYNNIISFPKAIDKKPFALYLLTKDNWIYPQKIKKQFKWLIDNGFYLYYQEITNEDDFIDKLFNIGLTKEIDLLNIGGAGGAAGTIKKPGISVTKAKIPQGKYINEATIKKIIAMGGASLMAPQSNIVLQSCYQGEIDPKNISKRNLQQIFQEAFPQSTVFAPRDQITGLDYSKKKNKDFVIFKEKWIG